MSEKKEEKLNPVSEDSILGLSTNELAGLKVDELLENKTAITMLMHYYKKLVDENNALQNENNTLETYVDGYKKVKQDSSIGSGLLVLSNILIAFGVNLFTNEEYFTGAFVFVPGLIVAIFGLYFSYRKD
ncbi:MAG: hypothetical protein WDZ38_00580 [Balneolaceae bacterium]